MPIDRNALHHDSAAANAFLSGQGGTLLHDLGHHAAMNAQGLIGGHLVVEEGGAGAGFLVAKEYAHLLDGDRPRGAFICAAGAVTESYFCGTILHRRLGPDIARYIRLRPPAKKDMRTIDLLDIWRNDYGSQIAALATCIEKNFDRCTELMRSHPYCLQGYSVIPSWVLSTPTRRSWRDRYREFLATNPLSVRRHSLQLYLAGKPRL